MPKLDIKKIADYLKKISEERDWNQLHSPKNIAMALNVEAGELLEIFQWLTEKQSFEIKKNNELYTHVKEEVSDVLYHLVRLSDILEIDLEDAFWEKQKKNLQKYPVEKGKELTRKMKTITD